ncbi:dihydroxy-acid dehydratase [Mesobacterium sp. TK19101]|uniref:Dihydroxy-acid dehydratase n=1 Tax=Mesobacterium hydrothermale TaxID=3111907 RepID=A0ABU6HG25_9RHOB|nr:dihydroxy-acid dehydratase [Mesobacterium sp. TK19101]MEC3861367.1 dihydroxy-acid dehydratase [Mesobacterium sp. TK19101]
MPNSAPEARDATPAKRGFFAAFLPTDTDNGALFNSAPKPLATARVANGDVVIAGPSGYCVDPETLDDRGRQGFAVIASCRILSNGAVGPVVTPVVVTASIGPTGKEPDLPSAEALAASLEVPLLQALDAEGAVLAHLGGGGSEVIDNGDTRHWRAAMHVNDHLVGLALYAPSGSALAGPDGARFLADTVGMIRANSPKQAPATGPISGAAPESPGQQGLLPGLGVFGRLFSGRSSQ